MDRKRKPAGSTKKSFLGRNGRKNCSKKRRVEGRKFPASGSCWLSCAKTMLSVKRVEGRTQEKRFPQNSRNILVNQYFQKLPSGMKGGVKEWDLQGINDGGGGFQGLKGRENLKVCSENNQRAEGGQNVQSAMQLYNFPSISYRGQAPLRIDSGKNWRRGDPRS